MAISQLEIDDALPELRSFSGISAEFQWNSRGTSAQQHAGHSAHDTVGEVPGGAGPTEALGEHGGRKEAREASISPSGRARTVGHQECTPTMPRWPGALPRQEGISGDPPKQVAASPKSESRGRPNPKTALPFWISRISRSMLRPPAQSRRQPSVRALGRFSMPPRSRSTVSAGFQVSTELP
jgi:hypothetical protein